MPGREFSIGGYRFGFNGKENDNEVKGVAGSQQDYGFRIYDPRLGRFFSIDPLSKEYPYFTPYQFSGNNPIASVDIDGLEGSENFNYNEYPDLSDCGSSVNHPKQKYSGNIMVRIVKSEEVTQRVIQKNKTFENRNMSKTYNTHGKGATVHFDGSNISNYPNNSDKKNASEIKSLKAMAEKIKAKGNLVFLTCYGAKGSAGRKLGSSLVDLISKDIDIYLSEDYVEVATDPKKIADGSKQIGSYLENGFRKFNNKTPNGSRLKDKEGNSGDLRLNNNPKKPGVEVDKEKKHAN